MLNRRQAAALLGAAALWPAIGATEPAARLGPSAPFSWDHLRAMALQLASQPWQPPVPSASAKSVDYDDLSHISYRADRALWAGQGSAETRFFPLHKYADIPVDISVIENGVARRFAFSPDLFAVTGAKAAAPPVAGFSGFRLMNAGGRNDWLAFQGASYFRSAGALDQYGLSTRGLAINTGIDGKEEFPIFTRFWLEHGPGDVVTVYALLDGRSVAGAYRIVCRKTPAGPVQEVSLSLHLRAAVERLGFAPLTSMFWYGEGNRAAGSDWRLEIHDSDGLALLTGAGERIWRPLANPARPTTNSFADRRPGGYGLLQRDRAFADYQDDGAFYEKRPNLWVTPVGDWGAGSVMLYEIPTRGETDDNIVAFWVPAAAAAKGATYELSYRLDWSGTDPAPGALARAVDCRTGTAGRPGHEPIAGARKLVADFTGDRLAGLGRDSGVSGVVSVSGGKILSSYAYPVAGMKSRWRLMVDVAHESSEPAQLRAYLKRGGDALSETLLYTL